MYIYLVNKYSKSVTNCLRYECYVFLWCKKSWMFRSHTWAITVLLPILKTVVINALLPNKIIYFWFNSGKWNTYIQWETCVVIIFFCHSIWRHNNYTPSHSRRTNVPGPELHTNLLTKDPFTPVNKLCFHQSNHKCMKPNKLHFSHMWYCTVLTTQCHYIRSICGHSYTL